MHTYWGRCTGRYSAADVRYLEPYSIAPIHSTVTALLSMGAGGGMGAGALGRAEGPGDALPRQQGRGPQARRHLHGRHAPTGERDRQSVPARRPGQALPPQLPGPHDHLRRQGLQRQLLADLRAPRPAGLPSAPALHCVRATDRACPASGDEGLSAAALQHERPCMRPVVIVLTQRERSCRLRL